MFTIHILLKHLLSARIRFFSVIGAFLHTLGLLRWILMMFSTIFSILVPSTYFASLTSIKLFPTIAETDMHNSGSITYSFTLSFNSLKLKASRIIGLKDPIWEITIIIIIGVLLKYFAFIYRQ